ncbi:ABC transporter permease [Gordonia sp. ABSL49_1]|uniref:ABC transporter permease n=1 Tax=Gordonia sp. ABSL49_1 TaxID=2920941 RepID=UPI001F0D57D2|nr:ABC transporter permease [Gordonia sp. ABSL49_1]MCH5644806.1 ABC transporter permease [Gordonia sp. ABSL49_1]
MTLQLDKRVTASPTAASGSARQPATAPTTSPARTAHPVRRLLPSGRAARVFRQSVGLVLVVVIWQLGARSWLGPTTPAPTEVINAGADLIRTGELWHHLAASTRRVAIGLAIGITIGVVLGAAAGTVRIAEDLVNAPIQVLRMMPAVALVPVFIIWFGIDDTFKIALIIVAPIFPMYVNVFAGIRNVDHKLIEAAHSLDLTRAEMLRFIVLPGALPQTFVGLRQALGIGWLVLVVAEMQTTTVGLGFVMNDAKEYLRTDQIFLVLVIYAVLGLLTDTAVKLLEHRFLSWRNGFQGA